MKNYTLSLFIILVPFLVRSQTIITEIGNGTNGDSGDGGAATAAQINYPGTVNFDSHWNLFFSEFSNRIRKVNKLGVISTIAGNGIAGFSGDNGPATNAELNQPGFATIDINGNVFFSDSYNNRVREIDTSGIITTIAGNGIGGFMGDGGPASASELYSPAGLCFDTVGNLYVADHANLRIRKIDIFGIISTIAGTGLPGVNGDGGLALSAGIGGVTGLCIDREGNLYMTDGFSKIRKISLTTGLITTFAGKTTVGFSGDGGPASAAELSGPWYVTFDAYGNLFTSDNNNNRIRMINNSGIIYTVAGNGISGYNGDGEAATAAAIYSPRGIAIDSCSNLCIADNGNSRIRKVIYAICDYESAKNIEADMFLNIYPNPACDRINIDKLSTKATYNLYDMIGVIVQKGTLYTGDNCIYINAMPNGVYLLEVIDDEQQKKMLKILKQ